MNNRNYSVTIRTLGYGGPKYKKTLESIAAQTIQPKEIIIVLPYNHKEPLEKLGYEKFIYSPKGMVSQRIVGFNNCKEDFILALDDDVQFECQFVENLFEALERNDAQFCSPAIIDLESSNDTPKTAANRGIMSNSKLRILYTIKDYLLGVQCKRKLNDNFAIKIWRTGGFIVNTNLQNQIPILNQSGQGACIFGKRVSILDINFHEEMWLEDTIYALPDDMVFFYKLYLNGNKIIYNKNIRLIHLDAGTSLTNKDKYINNIYASARNGTIFWHRFIYSCQDKKLLSVLCISRRIFFTTLFSLIKGILKRNLKPFKTYIKAYCDGFKYINCSKYKNLNKIKTNI